MKPYKILYIEDYEPAAVTLDFLLGDLGHDAVHARSGTQALDMVEKERFDLVLIDINLPGMSGYEIAENIKQLDSYNHDMVLVGYTADVDIVDKGRYGLFDFVEQKTLDPAVLREKVPFWMTRNAP